MFKLRLQFFWVMLALTSLMSVGIYLFIKISFKDDFWDYIEKKETRFAQPLVEDLTKNYAQHQNWDWIPDWSTYLSQQLQFQRSNWRREMRALGYNDKNNTQTNNDSREHDPKEFDPNAPRDRNLNKRRDPPPFGSPDFDERKFPEGRAPEQEDHGEEKKRENNPFKSWRDSRQRPPMEAMRTLYLENAQHKLIQGDNPHPDDSFLIPLKVNNQIVGYLGIPFNPAIRDLQDANFAKVQENKLGFIVIAALILSLLAAFPLAHLLTTRIQRLVEQVSLYSKGMYQQRLKLRGQDEINILAEHLNHLGETLANTENTRRQWVADISHELRTPIAVLQAELEAMEDGVRAIDKNAIKRLVKHSERLKFLVNDLYELSLTDLGGMTYQKKPIDLASSVNEAISSLQPQFAQNGIELTTYTSGVQMPFLGDTQRLQQMFVNLLKNSLNYTNSPGQTRVSASTTQDSYIIVIEDTPPGVREDHLAKLFDRLYRADSSRTRATGGAGLGLSICKNIVAAHDGKISASTSEMGGLKITVEFPIRG